jgi:hypothetical protein
VSVSPEPKPCKPTKRGKEAPFRRYVYLRKGAVEYCPNPFFRRFLGFLLGNSEASLAITSDAKEFTSYSCYAYCCTTGTD